VEQLPISRIDQWRGGKQPSAVYRFGPYELDTSRYELRRGGVRLRLARAPMDLLVLLIQRRDTLLNREDIASRLWPQPNLVDVDQGINTAIRRIREVLGDDPAKPRFVETVVGKGYRFIAEVKEARSDLTLVPLPVRPEVEAEPEFSEETPEVPEPPAAPEQQNKPANEPQTKDRRKRFIIPAVIALVLILVIAYVGWRLHKQSAVRYSASLVQVTTNDSEQRVTAAAISPDGRWIVYADINGVSLRTLQSGETVALRGPENFHADRIAWFPDQTKVLVSGFDGATNNAQIWMVFITGADPQLFRKDAHNGVPSPDGSRILFTTVRDSELWVAGAAGEGAHQLLADSTGRAFSGIFWSRDGKRVSYLRRLSAPSNDDVYESADAASGKVLATNKNFTYDSASVLDDGRVFFLRDSPIHMNDNYTLWVVRTDDATGAFVSTPRQVAALDHGRAFALTGSEDGNRLSLVIERGQPHVYVGTLHQPGPSLTDVQRLTYDTRTDYPHSWLHDNQTVIFESDRSGMYRLYRQRLQDHVPQEISTGAGPAVLPHVTPDGKWILYAMKPNVLPSAKDRLFRVPAEGGQPEEVPTGGTLEEVECPLLSGPGCVLLSEEGKALVYYALDPVKGKGRELARTAWQPHVIEDWGVSPDDSAVALVSHDSSNPRIRIIPLNPSGGSHETELPVSGFGKLWGISWAADGKGWYVASATQVGTSLLYVSQKGEVHALRNTPLGTWGVPSPDGSKLAFVDKAVDSNAWMWQVERKQ